jgi:hypothetical protein
MLLVATAAKPFPTATRIQETNSAQESHHTSRLEMRATTTSSESNRIATQTNPLERSCAFSEAARLSASLDQEQDMSVGERRTECRSH